MKIIYKDEPLSLIKAVLYAEFAGSEEVRAEDIVPMLFNNEQTVEADDLDIEDLIRKTRLHRKKPELFSSPQQLTMLVNILRFGFRHGSDKRFKIMLAAVHAAVQKGLLSVLNGTITEGKELLRLSEDVQAEVRLSGQKLKFALLPQTDNVLYARHTLIHDTADLVIRSWSKIYPDYSFVLLLPNKTVIGNRHGCEESEPFFGTPAILTGKIAALNILNNPRRSKLAAQHASYVHMERNTPLELPCTKSVNYVDFYNKIKRGEDIL
jgi:hypothetical protein